MFRALSSVPARLVPALKFAPFTAVRALHFGPTKQHYDSPDNNVDTPFDFTADNYRRVHEIMKRYPKNYKQSAVMPLLDLAQRQCGNYIPLAAMNKIAEILEMPPVKVYEVVTFYTMYRTEKVGKFFIQACGTTPCMLCGSEEIFQTLEKELGIKDGETTKDGLFTLLKVECLGACANAPMVQINDDYFECLTPKTTVELLNYIRKEGKLPPLNKSGSKPMNGQESCEGINGQNTLLGEIRGKYCRELPAKKVNPKQVFIDMYGEDSL